PERALPLLYGPEPVIVAERGKIIRGVVREKDTGKVRPGVNVYLTRQRTHPWLSSLSAKTDAEGRYAIRGARKATSYELRVYNDQTAGLLGSRVTVPDTNGYQPVTADLTVSRKPKEVPVTGRLIDAATGKGTRGRVWVVLLADNPIARTHPEY